MGACVRVEVVLLAKKLRFSEVACGHIKGNYKVTCTPVRPGPEIRY